MSNGNRNIVSDVDRLLTAQDVAEILNVSDKLVYAMALRGEMPCVRIGEKLVRFSRTEVDEWLASQKYNDFETSTCTRR